MERRCSPKRWWRWRLVSPNVLFAAFFAIDKIDKVFGFTVYEGHVYVVSLLIS